ncbi:MAG: DUF488 domain-containing protein [Planctomycetes bacterium]|nr:DUF488 domain-containing protein [Planctomycetota bacterium]
MKIYTSRYGNKEIAQTGLVPVGISTGNPRFKTAFKVQHRIKALAPTRDMLPLPYKTYKKIYFGMLGELDEGQLKEHFKKISNGKDLVFLCFEDLSKEGEWCHRRMFAEWWQGKTGDKVEELMPLTSQAKLGT